MKLIPAPLANKFGRQLLHLQKSSPQIAFAGGIAAGLGATVLACRSTLKLSDTLSGFEQQKADAALLHKTATNNPDITYTDKEYAKDLTVLKVRTVLAVTKLYAPAAGLAMLSVALLTGSHVTLTRRNASVAAAYASVDQAFNNYRDRVRSELGEDQDRNFRYGSEVVEEKVEDADGKKKTIKHTRVADGEMSLYARFFDQMCDDWRPNPEYNKIFLKAQQAWANDMLRARGHVFLNEVYDNLGLPRSKEGAVVGWVLDKGGDNFVDFGVFDNPANDKVRDFVNGREHSILLDFNVDGVIFDKI
jgi:hypothetical protein